MTQPSPADIPVFILCGGRGTRLGEIGAVLPKPMVEVGDRPILIHIMNLYAHHGFRRFILCAGWKSEVIAHYFLNQAAYTQDFTIETRTREVSFHQSGLHPDWQVTVAHTGLNAMTGARVARAAKRYLGDAQHFAVTYGDGLTDVDLGSELAFHLEHDRLGTVLGVHPRSQFGAFALDDDGVRDFAEKPRLDDEWVNGGFFFFRRGFLELLDSDDSCVLEQGPLRRLASARQLQMYRHRGFWNCMDTIRDRDEMRAIWESGAAPWRGETR